MTALLTLIRTEAAKWLAIIAAVLASLAYVRKTGKDAEKTANLRKEVEHVTIANDARNRVDAAGGVERDRLRKKWTRPKR